MIPETLDDWTFDVVQRLLAQRVFETDRFDFKEMLPHAKSDDDKRRLRRTIAAFANTEGGFIVFGVKDDKQLPTDQRMVGLPRTLDLPEQFGNHPAACHPFVEWSFKNPAISLKDDRVLHVVYIPPSPRKPHGVFEDDRWWFQKRTNKGIEAMSYEEVRLAFQDAEIRRTKLVLLSSELGHLRFLADRVLDAVREDAKTDGLVIDVAWMTRYPTNVLDLLLGDAFSLVTRKLDLWAALQALRTEARYSNSMAEAYSHYDFIRSTKDPQQRAKLYKMMRQRAQSIDMLSAQAKTLVDEALAGKP